MVKEAVGRIFRRKDGKYMLYIPIKLAEDTNFPFPVSEEEKSKPVNLSFKLDQPYLLMITRHEEHESKTAHS